MDINKVIYKVVKIAFIIMLFLLLVYATMRISSKAFDFGYHSVIEQIQDSETVEE